MNTINKMVDRKNSGIPRLDQIPAHWSILPGRACFSEKKVRNTGLKEKTVLSLSYGRIIVKPEEKLHGLVPESFETYQIIDPGDIIFRPTDLQNDHTSLRFGISHNRGIITSAYMCLESKPIIRKNYCYLLLHTYDLLKVFYGLGSGLRQNIDWTDFKYLPCLIPPLEEQDAIVSYLDHVDRVIKRYIRAKQHEIVLLTEQKSSIIQFALKTGLNPDTTQKASENSWLGDIPSHWECKRLKNICKMIVSNVDKHSYENEIPIKLCNYVDVYKHERIDGNIQFMKATAKPEEIKRYKLQLNDVLITKDSEMWNDIGIPSLVESSEDNLVCGYHLAILRPDIRIIDPEFLLRVLQYKNVSYQFHVSANGVTRYGISHLSIQNVEIPLPPLSEQKAIVRYLNDGLRTLTSSIKKFENEITLVNELKKRLITDIVLGKIRVGKTVQLIKQELDDLDVEESIEDMNLEDDSSSSEGEEE